MKHEPPVEGCDCILCNKARAYEAQWEADSRITEMVDRELKRTIELNEKRAA
jgi:hypothetical protein